MSCNRQRGTCPKCGRMRFEPWWQTLLNRWFPFRPKPAKPTVYKSPCPPTPAPLVDEPYLPEHMSAGPQ